MAENREMSLADLSHLPVGKFCDQPWYNRFGDCLMWYFSKGESYRERIDDRLTVYKSFADNSVIGCQVKGVRAILHTLGQFGVEYKEKGVSLALLFWLSHYNGSELPASPAQAPRKPIYDQLLEEAGDTTVEIEEDDENLVRV